MEMEEGWMGVGVEKGGGGEGLGEEAGGETAAVK